jgi:hypothetical protein
MNVGPSSSKAILRFSGEFLPLVLINLKPYLLNTFTISLNRVDDS